MRQPQFRLIPLVLLVVHASYAALAAEAPDRSTIRKAYKELIAKFPEERQGFGVDKFLEATEEQPMTYGLVLSAEAIRLKNDPNDESRRRVKKATVWLLKNQDLDRDGKPGWGLPQPWDAWADGTRNPGNQPYTITTAICLNGLLDSLAVTGLWTNAERNGIRDLMKRIVLRWCNEVWSPGYGGGFFWYSPAKQDEAFGINAPAMFLSSITRFLTEQADDLSAEEHQLIQDRADALVRAIVNTVQLREKAPFWRYAPLPNRFHNDRPNDLLHQAYILWGTETYRDCGGRVKLPWTRAQAVESIDRYWRDGRMWEYPQDAPGDKTASINAPPRLWCIGMALAFYAKWGDANQAAKTFTVIDRDYGPWPDLRFQPKGSLGDGEKTFYPRQAAHVLFGLALYAYPPSKHPGSLK
jgi:hypothetical protein